MASKPNILIDVPANIPVPASGEVQYFVNTADDNKPYYMDDAGDHHIVESFIVEGGSADSGSEITKALWDSVACALKSGLMTPAELNTFATAGFAVAKIPRSAGGYLLVTGIPATVQTAIDANTITF